MPAMQLGSLSWQEGCLDASCVQAKLLSGPAGMAVETRQAKHGSSLLASACVVRDEGAIGNVSSQGELPWASRKVYGRADLKCSL